jgi:hypothetical protein
MLDCWRTLGSAGQLFQPPLTTLLSAVSRRVLSLLSGLHEICMSSAGQAPSSCPRPLSTSTERLHGYYTSPFPEPCLAALNPFAEHRPCRRTENRLRCRFGMSHPQGSPSADAAGFSDPGQRESLRPLSKSRRLTELRVSPQLRLEPGQSLDKSFSRSMAESPHPTVSDSGCLKGSDAVLLQAHDGHIPAESLGSWVFRLPSVDMSTRSTASCLSLGGQLGQVLASWSEAQQGSIHMP